MHRQGDLVAMETARGVHHHTGRNVDKRTLQSTDTDNWRYIQTITTCVWYTGFRGHHQQTNTFYRPDALLPVTNTAVLKYRKEKVS